MPVSDLPKSFDAQKVAFAFLELSSITYRLAQESFDNLLHKSARIDATTLKAAPKDYEGLWKARNTKAIFCAPYEAKEIGYLELDESKWHAAFSTFWASKVDSWDSSEKCVIASRNPKHEKAAWPNVWEALVTAASHASEGENPFDAWYLAFGQDQTATKKPAKPHQKTP